MGDADVLLLMKTWNRVLRLKDQPEKVGLVATIHLTQVEWRLREALKHVMVEYKVSPRMQKLIEVALYPPHLRELQKPWTVQEIPGPDYGWGPEGRRYEVVRTGGRLYATCPVRPRADMICSALNEQHAREQEAKCQESS